MKNNLRTLTLLAALASGHIAHAAVMGTAFTYQGRLNDGGQPVSGNYDLLFSLMDAATSGSPIGPTVALPNTTVSNGYFTVELDFGPNAFNGSARWLDIGVRTNCNCLASYTLLSSRQSLTPTPYALFSQTAFAALNAANVTDGAITSSKLAPGAVTWASLTGVPAGFADGVDNDTTYIAGAGLTLSGANNQFSVNFGGTGSAAVAARSDHGHFSAAWGGSAPFGVGLIVTNGAANGAALYGQQGTASGFPYLFGNTAGVWGESSQGSGVYGASATSAGVRGVTLSTNSHGLHGSALKTNGTSSGVYGTSASATGVGVRGLAGTPATNSGNVYFGTYQSGVVGESSAGVGVFGISDLFLGVHGASAESTGVFGESVDGTGVRAYSDAGAAFSGFAWYGPGLEVTTSTGDLIDCYQIFNGTKFRVTADGEVYAAGAFHPNGADFAEMLPAQNAVEPGDVLVIGEDGKLIRCTRPYQETVAGVHATKPGLLGGAENGADLTGKIPLAVVGVVPVKVTNENGSIKPGDKLTTSSTAGHAMKADKHAEIGTVIGKALEGFDGPQGVIQMLVILQ